MPRPTRDLKGQTFGRLTVVKRIRHGSARLGAPLWEATCNCGSGEKIFLATSLLSGATKSCGCLAAESRRSRFLVHGCDRVSARTKEYRVWLNLKSRCLNRNNPDFKNYGAAGISVCRKWEKNFPAFLADMGKCPADKFSIDRINNAKGYYKSNCRWADYYDQANNMKNNIRVTVAGETRTVSQWAREFGLNPSAVYCRRRRGWPIARLFIPI